MNSKLEFKIKRFDELTATEIYEILKARANVFIVEQDCNYQDMDDKDKNAWHVFLEKDSKIIAYLRILDKGIAYDEIAIGRVLTLPSYRRKGYARQMLSLAIDFVEEKLKESQIRVFAQSYLLKFYESHGFVPVSGMLYHDGKEHIEMLRG